MKKYLFLMILALQGCVINKQVTLGYIEEGVPSTGSGVSEVVVSAPSKGDNVLVYADYITTGVNAGTATVVFENYKRGEFQYFLEEDSAPIIKNAISGVLMEGAGSESINMMVDFKYYIPSTGLMSSEIGIAFKMTLSKFSGEEEVFEVNVTEPYSTFLVTYPRSGSFVSLFNKAINEIKEKIRKSRSAVENRT